MSTQKHTCQTIAAALNTLGLNGDVLFQRIREDLDRGLVKEARAHLNFVDEMLAKKEEAP